jgi:hypothetical protein
MRPQRADHRRRRVAVAAGAISLMAAVGACRGDDSPSSEVASLGTGDTETTTDGTATESTAPSDPEEAALAFAECMREHGVDMPDPKVGDDGEVAINIGGGAAEMEEDVDIEAAHEACNPLMENARGDMDIDPEQQAEMQQQMLDYAECMRGEGIDMPDPTFSSDGGAMIVTGEATGPPGSDGEQPEVVGSDDSQSPPREFTEDPEFEAADEKCAAEVGMEDRPGRVVNSSSDDEGDG